MTQQTINMGTASIALHERGVSTSRKHGQIMTAPINTQEWLGHPIYITSFVNPTTVADLNKKRLTLRFPNIPRDSSGISTWAEAAMQFGRRARRNTTLMTVSIKAPTHVIMYTDTRPANNASLSPNPTVADPKYNRQNLKEYNLLHQQMITHPISNFGPFPSKLCQYNNALESIKTFDMDCDFEVGFRTLNQSQMIYPEVFTTHVLASYAGTDLYCLMEPRRPTIYGPYSVGSYTTVGKPL